MKIFNIVFGILSIIVAMVCFVFPFGSQMIYAYVIALEMGLMGIVLVVDYFTNRKARKAAGIQGASGGFTLAIGILGIIFMLLNVAVPFFTYAVEEFAVVLVAMLLLIEGVTFLAEAITNRNGYPATRRVFMVGMGILMVIGCLIAFLFPPLIISMFGVFLGIGMLIQGIGRIAIGVML